MLLIGQYNELTIAREVDFGLYLATDEGTEVLLPTRYAPEEYHIGDKLRVFVYTDSDDRPIATTEIPFATVGEFAYLQVSDVNDMGAFLDWGLAKDLLVPYSQQKSRMRRGGIYLVYVYLDHATMRVVASAKVERFIGNVLPDYKPGTEVKALITEHTDIGYRAIVDNLHRGMIYENELFRPLELEETVRAFVKAVRPDGKIDLTLSDRAKRRVSDLAGRILRAVTMSDGKLAMSDYSSPEEIQALFSCSKKDFKKALGQLYREGKIIIGDNAITLVKQ